MKDRDSSVGGEKRGLPVQKTLRVCIGGKSDYMFVLCLSEMEKTSPTMKGKNR